MPAERSVYLRAISTEDGRGLLALARDQERAADGADKLGKSFRATSEDSRRLGDHIDRTSSKVKDLRLQIARTGDTSLFGDLSKEESKLRRLKRLAQEITPGGGGGGGGSLLAGFPGIGGVPGPAVAGIAAGAAAISPFLGGVVAAAVLGGVGTGGLIGGIALASKDTRVRSAFKELGHNMFTELGDASAPLVDPLVDAARMFGKAFRGELPAFQRDFQVLAGSVAPISQGLAGFVHQLHPGLSSAFRASLPLAEQFGKELERFGGATSDSLESMARSAPGAKTALHDLFTVTDDGLRELGRDIHVLSETYDAVRKLGLVAPPEWLIQASKGTGFAWVDVMGEASDAWARFNVSVEVGHRNLVGVLSPAQKLTRELEAQARAAERAVEALDKYLDNTFRQLDATDNWNRALLDLRDSVKDNGTSLAQNTRDGLANREALLAAARATREMHDAGLLTDAAYTAQIRSLITMATQLGLNREQVLRLIGALEMTPKQIIADVLVRVNTAFGALNAFIGSSFQGGAGGSKSQQGRGGTDFSITPVVRQPSHQQFIEGSRDAGGPVRSGRSYLIGGKPEILTMGSSPGYVTPMGGTHVTLSFAGTGNAWLDSLLAQIRAEVTHQGPSVIGVPG